LLENITGLYFWDRGRRGREQNTQINLTRAYYDITMKFYLPN
jgi:hypothetical protein